MTRIGYQIPNFNYPGVGSDGIFDLVVQQAKEADKSGFDTLMVMDHFYQLPMIGPPEHPMLECYTVLSALAQHTSNVRLGALVTGNTYRNPAILAKTITTLDVVSNGRAKLGIGAGWYEMEHDAFGIEFGTFADRFEKLEESLRIIGGMLRGERPSLDGKHYRAVQAINEPAPVGKIPIMIGGGGEKKTLRMVAQYADESDLVMTPDGEIQRKLDALEGHCDKLGRDRSEIEVSVYRNVVIAPTTAEAERDLDAFLAPMGMSLSAMPAEQRAIFESMFILGDPDTVGEQLAATLATGVDGLTMALTSNGHVEGRVELLGQVASAAFNS